MAISLQYWCGQNGIVFLFQVGNLKFLACKKWEKFWYLKRNHFKKKLTLPIIFWLESPGETATKLGLDSFFYRGLPSASNGIVEHVCRSPVSRCWRGIARKRSTVWTVKYVNVIRLKPNASKPWLSQKFSSLLQQYSNTYIGHKPCPYVSEIA